MCEVNSCCCLSLRQGCIIIGGVTILVSLVQTVIFSWVLVETYQSYQSSLSYQEFSIEANSSMDESSSSTYSFDSPKCPFGFLTLTIDNTSSENGSPNQDDIDQNSHDALMAETINLIKLMEAKNDDDITFSDHDDPTTKFLLQTENATQSTSYSDSEEIHQEHQPYLSSSIPSAILLNSSQYDNTKTDDQNTTQEALHSSSSNLLSSTLSSSAISSDDGDDTFTLIEVLSSQSAPSSSLSSSTNPLHATSSNSRTRNKSRENVKCSAPGQGLLWVLVVASVIYIFVGLLLIFAISYCVSWQLSIWFFYTVGYNLFLLIVAMTDGNYTSLPDISSYVVFIIMTYCIIVVDSYYEKQLLHDEMDKNGSNTRRRSSVVIIRSSPDTPTSTQPEYIPPTSYRVTTTNHNLAPLPPPHSLAPPPSHTLAPPTAYQVAPPPQKFVQPMKLAPPPSTKPSGYH